MIFFVLTWWIINEFEKVISRFTKTNEGPNETELIQNLSTIPKHF